MYIVKYNLNTVFFVILYNRHNLRRIYKLSVEYIYYDKKGGSLQDRGDLKNDTI